jgi:hypothetical protein
MELWGILVRTAIVELPRIQSHVEERMLVILPTMTVNLKRYSACTLKM